MSNGAAAQQPRTGSGSSGSSSGGGHWGCSDMPFMEKVKRSINDTCAELGKSTHLLLKTEQRDRNTKELDRVHEREVMDDDEETGKWSDQIDDLATALGKMPEHAKSLKKTESKQLFMQGMQRLEHEKFKLRHYAIEFSSQRGVTDDHDEERIVKNMCQMFDSLLAAVAALSSKPSEVGVATALAENAVAVLTVLHSLNTSIYRHFDGAKNEQHRLGPLLEMFTDMRDGTSDVKVGWLEVVSRAKSGAKGPKLVHCATNGLILNLQLIRNGLESFHASPAKTQSGAKKMLSGLTTAVLTGGTAGAGDLLQGLKESCSAMAQHCKQCRSEALFQTVALLQMNSESLRGMATNAKLPDLQSELKHIVVSLAIQDSPLSATAFVHLLGDLIRGSGAAGTTRVSPDAVQYVLLGEDDMPGLISLAAFGEDDTAASITDAVISTFVDGNPQEALRDLLDEAQKAVYKLLDDKLTQDTSKAVEVVASNFVPIWIPPTESELQDPVQRPKSLECLQLARGHVRSERTLWSSVKAMLAAATLRGNSLVKMLSVVSKPDAEKSMLFALVDQANEALKKVLDEELKNADTWAHKDEQVLANALKPFVSKLESVFLTFFHGAERLRAAVSSAQSLCSAVGSLVGSGDEHIVAFEEARNKIVEMIGLAEGTAANIRSLVQDAIAGKLQDVHKLLMDAMSDARYKLFQALDWAVNKAKDAICIILRTLARASGGIMDMALASIRDVAGEARDSLMFALAEVAAVMEMGDRLDGALAGADGQAQEFVQALESLPVGGSISAEQLGAVTAKLKVWSAPELEKLLLEVVQPLIKLARNTAKQVLDMCQEKLLNAAQGAIDQVGPLLQKEAGRALDAIRGTGLGGILSAGEELVQEEALAKQPWRVREQALWVLLQCKSSMEEAGEEYAAVVENIQGALVSRKVSETHSVVIRLINDPTVATAVQHALQENWDTESAKLQASLEARQKELDDLSAQIEAEKDPDKVSSLQEVFKAKSKAHRARLKNMEGVAAQLQVICSYLEEMSQKLDAMDRKLDAIMDKLKMLDTIAEDQKEIKLTLTRMAGKPIKEVFEEEAIKAKGRKKELLESLYLPIMGLPQSKDHEEYEMLPAVMQFVDDHEHEVLLIAGVSGSGKSTFMQHLYVALWERYLEPGNREPIVAVFVKLPRLQQPLTGLIKEALQDTFKLEPPQVKEWRERMGATPTQFRVVLVLDAYDELAPELFKKNLYDSNDLEFECSSLKVIVTCRAEMLGEDYKDWFVPVHSDDPNFDTHAAFQEMRIAPLGTRLDEYLAAFVARNFRCAICPPGRMPPGELEPCLAKRVDKYGLSSCEVLAAASLHKTLFNLQEPLDSSPDAATVTATIEDFAEAVCTTAAELRAGGVPLAFELLWQIGRGWDAQKSRLGSYSREQSKAKADFVDDIWMMNRYSQQIDSLPEVKEMLTTPFMISMIVQVIRLDLGTSSSDIKALLLELLPGENGEQVWSRISRSVQNDLDRFRDEIDRSFAAGKNCLQCLGIQDHHTELVRQVLRRRPMTPVLLYERFINDWVARESTKHVASRGVQTLQALQHDTIEFSRRLALAMVSNNLSSVDYTKSGNLYKGKETEWDEFFKQDEITGPVRAAAPLRAGATRIEFIHKSIMEFFVSKELLEKITEAVMQTSIKTEDLVQVGGKVKNQSDDLRAMWKEQRGDRVKATELARLAKYTQEFICALEFSSFNSLDVTGETAIIQFCHDHILNNIIYLEALRVIHAFRNLPRMDTSQGNLHAILFNDQGKGPMLFQVIRSCNVRVLAATMRIIFEYKEELLLEELERLCMGEPVFFLMADWSGALLDIFFQQLNDIIGPGKDRVAVVARSQSAVLERSQSAVLEDDPSSTTADWLRPEVSRAEAKIHQLCKDVKDSNGRSFVHRAAVVGNADIVRWAIKAGLSCEQRDSLGHTPLLLAADKGQKRVIELLKQCDALLVNGDDQTALHLAVGGGHYAATAQLLEQTEQFPILLNKTDKAGRTALHCACGSSDIMQILLSFIGKQDEEVKQDEEEQREAGNESLGRKQQMYVQLKDGDGKTALHYAAGIGNTYGVALLQETDDSLAQVRDAAGMLPLHIALKASAPSSTLLHSLLRAFPSSVHEADPMSGKMPLHLGAITAGEEAMQTLLGFTDDPAALDASQKTPLDCALEAANAAAALVLVPLTPTEKVSISPILYAANHLLTDLAEGLIKRKLAEYTATDGDGCTAIEICSRRAVSEVSKTVRGQYERLARNLLDYAPVSLQLLVGATLNDEEVCKRALEESADVSAAFGLQWTALMCISGNGDQELVRQLLEGGASPEKQNAHGRCARRYAAASGHIEVLKLLEAPRTASLLRVAAQGGHVEAVRHLGDAAVDAAAEGETGLQLAAGCGSLEVVEVLLEDATEAYITRNAVKHSAIVRAIQHGHADIVACVLGKKLLSDPAAYLHACLKDLTDANIDLTDDVAVELIGILEPYIGGVEVETVSGIDAENTSEMLCHLPRVRGSNQSDGQLLCVTGTPGLRGDTRLSVWFRTGRTSTARALRFRMLPCFDLSLSFGLARSITVEKSVQGIAQCGGNRMGTFWTNRPGKITHKEWVGDDWSALAKHVVQDLAEEGVGPEMILGISAHASSSRLRFCAHWNGCVPKGDMHIEVHEEQGEPGKGGVVEKAIGAKSENRRVVAITGVHDEKLGSRLFLFYAVSNTPTGLTEVQFVQVAEGSWNKGAEKIIEQLQEAGVQRGQVLSIDAHNVGPNEKARFSAHYCLGLPAFGPLDLKYNCIENSKKVWSKHYSAAEIFAQGKELVSLTSSCNAGGKGVTYVFYYHEPTTSVVTNVRSVEVRSGSWNGAANAIIKELANRDVQAGQVLWIDAHNNNPDGDGIFSAYYSKNLPSKGELKMSYKSQNVKETWDTFYRNSAKQMEALGLEPSDVLGCTYSCNAKGRHVGYLFYQIAPNACASMGTVECEASSWDGAASGIIQKLQASGARCGQILSIDAHRLDPSKPRFSASFSKCLPDQGPLGIAVQRHYSKQDWEACYTAADEVLAVLEPGAAISATGCGCSLMGQSSHFVFHYTQQTQVEYIEVRTSTWVSAADKIIHELKTRGVRAGQVMSIDVHHQSPEEPAIISAHFCTGLPAKGPLNLTYVYQNAEKPWESMYTWADEVAKDLKSSEIVSITGSCNKEGRSVYFVFYQEDGTGIPNIKTIEKRADKSLVAAQQVIDELKSLGVKSDQVLSIDLHCNAGPVFIVTAQYSIQLPASGGNFKATVYPVGDDKSEDFQETLRKAATRLQQEPCRFLTACYAKGDKARLLCISELEGGEDEEKTDAGRADHGDSWEVLTSAAGTWKAAADSVLQKLQDAGVQWGQILTIDAYNLHPDKDACFFAFYNKRLPAKGPLRAKYYSLNNTGSWASHYAAAAQAIEQRGLAEEHILGLTYCLNGTKNGKSTSWVFYQIPQRPGVLGTVAHLECRGTSFPEAIKGLTAEVSAKGVRKGQLLSISAHQDGIGGEAILSAHYSEKLPDGGKLELLSSCDISNQSWDSFYRNAAISADGVRNNVLACTGSIGYKDGNSVFLVFTEGVFDTKAFEARSDESLLAACRQVCEHVGECEICTVVISMVGLTYTVMVTYKAKAEFAELPQQELQQHELQQHERCLCMWRCAVVSSNTWPEVEMRVRAKILSLPDPNPLLSSCYCSESNARMHPAVAIFWRIV